MVLSVEEPVANMRSAAHVIRSLDPKCGGTSISVPQLALATAETRRYSNCILDFGQECRNGLIGHSTSFCTLANSPLRVPLNMLPGGELDKAIEATDIVQIHGLWEHHCIMAGVLARRHHKPVVISAHGMLERWAIRNKEWKKWPYSLLIERPNLRRAAVLRALTRAEVDDYRRFGLSNPIVIVPNGVEMVPKANPELFLSAWPKLRGHRLVLYLSRIHYKKGVDLLVNAWAKITAQFPDVHLIVAGPDFENTQPSIERLVSELSISEKVTFTGPVYGDLKASLLSAASLFVLPSHSEGFSMAILEALASSLPVIITKGCNFPEVATSGAGWIISPVLGELECSLREALESSPSELDSRGQRGLQLVQDDYSWLRIGQQMADVYDWILGGPRPTTVEILD